MSDPGYLLDASALITPFYEGKLEALAKAFRFASRQVAQKHLEDWFEQGLKSRVLWLDTQAEYEVLRGGGRPGAALLNRLKNQNSYSPLQPRESTFPILEEIGHFIRDHFEPQQATKFLQKADPILVALAKDYGLILITEERHLLPEGERKTGKLKGEPRLPFVAFAFGVRCIPLMTALVEAP